MKKPGNNVGGQVPSTVPSSAGWSWIRGVANLAAKGGGRSPGSLTSWEVGETTCTLSSLLLI